MRAFLRYDLGKVDADIVRADPKRSRVVSQMQDLGSVEKSLARHAAAQDAKPADLLASFKDHRLQTLRHGGPRRSVAAAASANDCEIIIETRSRSAHSGSMRQAAPADKAGCGGGGAAFYTGSATFHFPGHV